MKGKITFRAFEKWNFKCMTKDKELKKDVVINALSVNAARRTLRKTYPDYVILEVTRLR